MTDNYELLDPQQKWLESCNTSQMPKEYLLYGRRCLLSRPFCFALTDHYSQSSHKVMIIGQETKNWGEYSTSWSIEQLQQTNVNYINVQLGYDRPHDGIKYNRSSFWRFFRQLKRMGLEPVWNNVDKYHLIGIDEPDKGKTYGLPYELEAVFGRPYGNDNKSLLRREIEIARPDGIIFVTGPYYDKTMAVALGIENIEITDYRPCKSDPCRDITDIANLNIPVLWTYHPAYLNRINKLNNTINRVKDIINIS